MKREGTARPVIDFKGHKPKVLILEARFYEDIADNMAAGAIAVLEQHGCTYERIAVPGALEIPLALQLAHGQFDAAIALGCIIRGETYHFEIVCNDSCRGLMDVSLKHNIPVGNGILTVENLAQAQERADPSQLDKGGDAAYAALKLLLIKKAKAA
ncbi:MAG: 6,7-dimethyl-8-ribityllumazine synthase [Alphaproteobacteria bacterium]|nr:6,7-dimethyl-8-ribityllumazine synthase [Alphaproteobacteria bacterium]